MESERDIEKRLRAFAKKRRQDAADFQLHPATRRLLQSEVARRRPAARSASDRWLGLLRPVLIYGTCFGVVMFMAAALLLPALSKSKSRGQLAGAMNNLKQIGLASQEFAKENHQRLPESLSELRGFTTSNTLIDPATGQPFVYVAGGRSADSLNASSVLAYGPEGNRRPVLYADGRVEVLDSKKFAEITNRGLLQFASSATPTLAEAPAAAPTMTVAATRELTDQTTPPATVALNGIANQSAFEMVSASRRRDFSNETAIKALGGALALNEPVASGLPVKSAALKDSSSVTQQYAVSNDKQAAQGLFKNALAASTVTPVLASFRLEQSGRTVAVVDEDGSVYRGELTAPLDETKTKAPAPSNELATASVGFGAKAETAAASYFFRVTGTNLTLQQNVVFTGSVMVAEVPVREESADFQTRGSGGGNIFPSAPPASSLPPVFSWTHSRIAGTVLVNSTNRVEVNARPVNP